MDNLKYFFVLVLFFQLHATLTAQNVSPEFSELKGMEDEQNNIHLLYRVYFNYEDSYSSSGSNNVYNLTPETLIDTLFLYDGYFCNNWTNGGGISIASYDFWKKDLSKHIYCGMASNCFEGWGYISRFDSQNVRSGIFESYYKISISRQNDSLIYCSYPILKSTDGGFNWVTITDSLSFQSLSPFNDQIYFVLGPFYWWGGSYLYKTTDGGSTFFAVDTSQNIETDFYYDIDGNHIYRTNSTGYPNRSLKVSANQGNAFTWQGIYSTNNNFYLSLDETQSGAIYLADGKRIFKSIDYGNTFALYKELGNRIIGIYKKPNSNKLYAATKYRIYELTDDTITVIKSLPVPQELFAFYPLSIGNYWIYKMEIWDNWPVISYSEDTFTREVVSKETLSNNKEYFKIEEIYHGSSYTNYVYERIDSVNGHVYRFDNECSNPDSEKVIDDFTSEVGDSLLNQRFTECWDSILTLFSEAGSENIFNENRNFRSFEYYSLMSHTYKLAQSLGIYNRRWGYDFGSTDFFLKGCVTDGIVYGDTTLTDIENESELPKEFALSQNYPNPFNPNTSIRYAISNKQLVQLKIYDILGSEVATLVNEEKPAGNYEVEFKSSVGSLQLASGIYFYRLKTGSFVETKKMILIK